MIARAAAAPNSSAAGAPALRAHRRFFYLGSDWLDTYFWCSGVAVQLVRSLSQLFAIRLNRWLRLQPRNASAAWIAAAPLNFFECPEQELCCSVLRAVDDT